MKHSRIRDAAQRTGIGTALILLLLIVLPSAFLGYLSWRAIENEKSYSLERLRESYQQFARLAARQIDHELGDLEARWTSEIERVLDESDSLPTAQQLARLNGKEALIAGYFLLSAPGRTAYPPIPLAEEAGSAVGWKESVHVREHELFTQLVARGEELEYLNGDLHAATAVYRQILDEVADFRLRAMAESYIGRTQLKNGDRADALSTFRRLLERYPEVRDLNRMYLRFLAQYQIAVALEGLGRNREALDALLELNQDLLKRSDAINSMQYTYYSDLIRNLVPRLLNGSRISDRRQYEQSFRVLGERTKKRVSDRYFLQLLDAELNEMVTRRKHVGPRVHYMSARAEHDPFLLVYRAFPDAQGNHVTGLLAAQIDLIQLQNQLSPAIRSLQSSSEAAVAILDSQGDEVIRAGASVGLPIAAQSLASPFDFWQVAIYPRDAPSALRRLDLRTTLWLWLIAILLLTILFGTYVFILRARHDAFLSRAQTTFVSNVTHELRTPLSSIKMFAELLEMQMLDGPSPSKASLRKNASQYLGIIRQECNRLSRLIDRVIDFSKVERRLEHYHFEYHDVGEIVAGIVESFRPHAEGHGFSLELSLEPSLPPLRIDTDAISQVLLNLLSNAVQYSDDVREIRVRVRREDSALAIDVSDRGVGIGPKEIGKVFDKFYTSRRRWDSRNPPGFGLGLTLSQEIVRAHGGEIRVHSELGKGSTFSVVIPIAVPASDGSAVSTR